MWTEAHRDREQAEVVAMGMYPALGVEKGEVLLQGRGYISPSLVR